ncbi:MAG: hypothetical protein AB7J35_18470 [Dehalococcoidia bacterium]
MGGLHRVLQTFPGAVAAITASVCVVSIALAALLGDFNRPAVALLMLLIGSIFLLMGAVMGGALPFAGSLPGAVPGLDYANTMNTELLLQQDLRDPELAAQAKRRRRLGLRILTSGAVLLVLGLVVA